MEQERSLEEEVVQLLLERGWTLTTAESCTGGLLAGRLLNVAGASFVYEEGYITYSNQAKERLLAVDHATLKSYGAVSDETARQMATGAKKRAGSDVALAVTGIAGPDGGTKEKAVGLVYIGCDCRGTVQVRRYQFSGKRQENRMCAVEEALKFLKERLEEGAPL